MEDWGQDSVLWGDHQNHQPIHQYSGKTWNGWDIRQQVDVETGIQERKQNKGYLNWYMGGTQTRVFQHIIIKGAQWRNFGGVCDSEYFMVPLWCSSHVTQTVMAFLGFWGNWGIIWREQVLQSMKNNTSKLLVVLYYHRVWECFADMLSGQTGK